MSAVQLLAATQGGSDPAPTRTTGLANCTGLAWRHIEPATEGSPLGSGRRGVDDQVSPERGEKRVLAQSGRGMILDLAGAVAQRRFLHKSQTAPGAHRCLRQRI